MRLIGALLACFCTLGHASSATTDFSDLWFNPAEPGWGVNMIQQDEILFVTLFVYSPNGTAAWYVGDAVRLVGSSGGTLTFSGPLYRTTGPHFGAGSYDPALVTVSQVGTFAFATSQINSGAISYTVDGTPVTKTVTRQTWAMENIAGSYLGGYAGTWSGCSTSQNGYDEDDATYTVTQNGVAITIREEGASYTCSYSGNYSQNGRMGTIEAGGLCSDGVNQSFIGTEVQVNLQGITMRAAVQQIGGCRFIGRLGGIRRGQ